jgi:spore coat protein U-like protein
MLLLVLALGAQQASAATLCRLASTGALNFGSYNTLATTPLDSLATITVTCDRNAGPPTTVVTVGVSQGSFGSSVNARRMRQVGGAGDFLSYGLYRDVGRSLTWGTTNGIDTVSRQLTVPNGGSASATFTIFGRMPALQDVNAGPYEDSVQITVTP